MNNGTARIGAPVLTASLALFLAFSFVDCSSAQVTFDDLRAGYESNLIEFQRDGVSFEFRIKTEIFPDAAKAWRDRDVRWMKAILSTGSLDDAEALEIQDAIEQKSNQQFAGSVNELFVQIAVDARGKLIRIARAREPVESDPSRTGEGRSDSPFPPADDPLGESESLDCFRSIYWSRDVNQTIVVLKDAVKSFGILEGPPRHEQLSVFSPIALDSEHAFEFIANSPIAVENSDAEPSLFFSWGDLVWRWNPEGDEERIVTDKSDGVFAVEIRSSWKDMEAYPGVQRRTIVEADVATDRGCLPIQLRCGIVYREIATGEVFGESAAERVAWSVVDCKHAERNGAFYISESTFRRGGIAADHSATDQSIRNRSELILGAYRRLKQGEEFELFRHLESSIDQVLVRPWSSNDGQLLVPECPPGVRYSNAINNEARSEAQLSEKPSLNSQDSVELVRTETVQRESGHVVPVQEEPVAAIQQSPQVSWMMRIGFWSMIVTSGVFIAWIVRRLVRSNAHPVLPP